MANDQITEINSLGSENLNALKAQILELHQEINHLNSTNQTLWSLLVNISTKMQISSTVIKASVSSLLGDDIIWDGSTQNELLEIIDSSANQVSKQIMLLTFNI